MDQHSFRGPKPLTDPTCLPRYRYPGQSKPKLALAVVSSVLANDFRPLGKLTCQNTLENLVLCDLRRSWITCLPFNRAVLQCRPQDKCRSFCRAQADNESPWLAETVFTRQSLLSKVVENRLVNPKRHRSWRHGAQHVWCNSSVKRKHPFFFPDRSGTLNQRRIFELSTGEWSLT